MPPTPAKKRQRPLAEPSAEAPSPELLQTLLEALPDAFFLLDARWCLAYVNPDMARLLGGAARLQDDVRRVCPELLELSRHLHFEQPVSEQPSVRYEHAWPEAETCLDVRVRPVEGAETRNRG